MRMRLLVIWITITAILQWTRAQEDNIKEVSVSANLDEDEGEPAVVEEQANQSTGMNRTWDFPSDNVAHPTVETKTELEVADVGMNSTNGMDLQSGDVNKNPEEPSEHQSGEHKQETSSPSETAESNKGEPMEKGESSTETAKDIPKQPLTFPKEESHPEGEQMGVASTETDKEVLQQPTAPPENESHPEEGGAPPEHEKPAEESSAETDKEDPPQPTVTSEQKPHPDDTKPEGVESPDYQNDGGHEDTTVPPTVATKLPPATPPVPDPIFSTNTCYSCMSCNGTIRNVAKTKCHATRVQKIGCFSVYVRDPHVTPGTNNYVRRGCISEMKDTLSLYCEKNAKLCLKCHLNDCNVQDMSEIEAAGGVGTPNPQAMVALLIWSIGMISCQVIL
ncbi:hypothetical protein KR009_010053 [Drosophila setifemur]|nr:hypothetical protein KR009_010053 [Drosophila setifemur]